MVSIFCASAKESSSTKRSSGVNLVAMHVSHLAAQKSLVAVQGGDDHLGVLPAQGFAIDGGIAHVGRRLDLGDGDRDALQIADRWISLRRRISRQRMAQRLADPQLALRRAGIAAGRAAAMLDRNGRRRAGNDVGTWEAQFVIIRLRGRFSESDLMTSLQCALDGFDVETFDHVALLHVLLIADKGHAAFLAALHFFDFILEALEGGESPRGSRHRRGSAGPWRRGGPGLR